MTWKFLWDAVKTAFLLLLHFLCIVAEIFLWQRPLNMPVPLLIVGIALVWIGVFILSRHHANAILRWMDKPSPGIQEIILEDQRRLELERDRMYAVSPWYDQ